MSQSLRHLPREIRAEVETVRKNRITVREIRMTDRNRESDRNLGLEILRIIRRALDIEAILETVEITAQKAGPRKRWKKATIAQWITIHRKKKDV